MEGEEELGEVDAQWHGLGVAKITLEVVGKAVTGTDMVWNKDGGHIFIESKTVDKGEENFDYVGEG